MAPYREEPEPDSQEWAQLDAEQCNLRAVRRFLTTACALLSVGVWLPHAFATPLSALWAAAGLLALVCWIQERHLARRMMRLLKKTRIDQIP